MADYAALIRPTCFRGFTWFLRGFQVGFTWFLRGASGDFQPNEAAHSLGRQDRQMSADT